MGNLRRSTLLLGLGLCLVGDLHGSEKQTQAPAKHEAQEKHAAPHWTYQGAGGPSHWGDMSDAFVTCRQGRLQSPINITRGKEGGAFLLDIQYRFAPLNVLNNGHTIQVNMGEQSHSDADTVEFGGEKHSLPGSTRYNSWLSISGERYKLVQFHFHGPSEHWLDGSPYPMEAHFVHMNDQGQLAVVGVFLKRGTSNSLLEQIWSYMPKKAGEVAAVQQISVDPRALLPKQLSYYHYRGSLTTPPCSEAVRWFVLQQAVEVSGAQISRFANVIGANARPIQALNSRFLIKPTSE